MKRRQFIQSIAAVAATPLLPTKVFAAGHSLAPSLYAQAISYAKKWDSSVPSMYRYALNLDTAQANNLFKRLIADRILNAPTAGGVGRAVISPLQTSGISKRLTKMRGKTDKGMVSKKLEDIKSYLTQDDTETDAIRDEAPVTAPSPEQEPK